jgi:hypothetical protein
VLYSCDLTMPITATNTINLVPSEQPYFRSSPITVGHTRDTDMTQPFLPPSLSFHAI